MLSSTRSVPFWVSCTRWARAPSPPSIRSTYPDSSASRAYLPHAWRLIDSSSANSARGRGSRHTRAMNGARLTRTSSKPHSFFETAHHLRSESSAGPDQMLNPVVPIPREESGATACGIGLHQGGGGHRGILGAVRKSDNRYCQKWEIMVSSTRHASLVSPCRQPAGPRKSRFEEDKHWRRRIRPSGRPGFAFAERARGIEQRSQRASRERIVATNSRGQVRPFAVAQAGTSGSSDGR